ncbi:MAG: AMIN domain-containing protein [Methylococcales symbiont of Hymedesmia sp. n. MRB-2018]|nr:MAG: AMIN domain-containing protein [Methylococcales symbiont of Hymedesmia sp. n. MRB-2018]KAF3982747.1 MAG: AMIN domain-containing protein [Methylococcales symbiont of Hymedesmia sp. n. MRB-2018]
MLKNKKILITFGLLLLSLSVYAQPISVNSLRYWTAPDHTRMVFDVTNTATHQISLLDKPARLVIDFHDAKLKSLLKQPPKDHPLFSRVRSAPRNTKDLRVVVDLKTAVNPKSFSLNPNKTYGHRLVVDLYDKTSKSNKYSARAVNSSKQVTKSVTSKVRDIVIAIDAGHGGEDPGARGPRGTQEKKVVFDISKRLAALINKKPGMKAVLVRKGDYYIKLIKRMEIARAAKADLFVSIHADAFKNPKVKGASVFTVSKRGASSKVARRLAQHENAADLVGGVKLSDKKYLTTILMDLVQPDTKRFSRNVAGKILQNFKNIGHLHSQNVQKAGFMVLKSPYIPSILVETAFISNPDEERKLRSAKHQQKMARAIFKGIVNHFEQYPPGNTYFALNNTNKHIISRGDTLSGIASQYGVSMRSIKTANALASNKIQIGQVLKIPRG